MHSFVKIIIVSAFLIFSGMMSEMSAQNGNQSGSDKLTSADSLTLRILLSTTLDQNYAVRLAENRVEITENNVAYGNAGFLPVVNARASATESTNDIENEFADGSGNSVDGAESSQRNAAIELNWTIFDGLAMFAEYNRLKVLEQIDRVMLEQTILNNLSQVITLYNNVLRSQDALDFLRETVAVSEERLKIERQRVEVGSVSKLQAARAEVDLNADRSELLRQEMMHQDVISALSGVIGTELDEESTFASADVSLQKVTSQELIEAILADNPSVMASKLRYQEANIAMKKAFAVAWPEIGVQTSYSYSSSESEGNFFVSNQQTGLTYGISLSWNLFNGFNDLRSYQNSKIAKKSADLALEEVRHNLETQAIAALKRYEKNVQIYEMEQGNSKTADFALEISKAQLEQGVISALEFREAQQSWLSARLRLINAKYEAMNSYAELKRLMNQTKELLAE
jgi:outer membrane protein TolC